jgi:hypothetical protein
VRTFEEGGRSVTRGPLSGAATGAGTPAGPVAGAPHTRGGASVAGRDIDLTAVPAATADAMLAAYVQALSRATSSDRGDRG